MPCEVNFEPAGLYVRFSGVVIAEDVVVLIDAMHSPLASTFRYRLTDCLAVDQIQLSNDQTAHILSIDYVFSLDSPKLQRVVVASDPQLIEKIDTLVKTHKAAPDIKLLATLKEAREWLERVCPP